jgi:hypothetical protein
MSKKSKKRSNYSSDGDVVGKAALELVRLAKEAKRNKGEEYPLEWDDPEFIRNNLAPALLNKLLGG